MSKQLQHVPDGLGGHCKRCGLSYTPRTAYTPCFEEGDTLEMWRARNEVALKDVDAPLSKEELS